MIENDIMVGRFGWFLLIISKWLDEREWKIEEDDFYMLI
jgi:hypothetical protein